VKALQFGQERNRILEKQSNKTKADISTFSQAGFLFKPFQRVPRNSSEANKRESKRMEREREREP